MAHKSQLVMRPHGSHKRVLLVATAPSDTEKRLDILRARGFEADAANCSDVALALSRSHSYDLIVLGIDLEAGSLASFCRKLQRINPNSTVACLADCKKPIPALPPDRLLWRGEPLEYFLARVEALAATA